MAVLIEVHARLATTAALFIGALALWALILRIRNQDLGGGWLGAAIIGEVLLIVQGLIGGYLYLQGLGGALPRPFLHILYGIVALITLPAAYGYFGNLEDERVKTLAMALVCAFLWGILQRATYVAQFSIPGL
jgi:heme A synthase